MLASLSLHFSSKELPIIAWVALGLIILFVVLLNVGLISALRHKNRSDYEVLKRFGSAIRNPNQEEDKLLNELNKRVKRLKEDGEQDHSVITPPKE